MGSNGCGLCGQHLSHMTQMGVAYVDCTCHALFKWAWLMWTTLVTHCSNGHGLCGQHMSDMAEMGVAYVDSTCQLKWVWLTWHMSDMVGVAYVDSTCHTWLKWAWLMWTALVMHCSNGHGLCGQHLSHIAQMGMAYVDGRCQTWLKWVWLMWTALVTHDSNGRGLCGLHLSHIAQMGVAYVDSTCKTWLKWVWLMWTAPCWRANQHGCALLLHKYWLTSCLYKSANGRYLVIFYIFKPTHLFAGDPFL